MFVLPQVNVFLSPYMSNFLPVLPFIISLSAMCGPLPTNSVQLTPRDLFCRRWNNSHNKLRSKWYICLLAYQCRVLPRALWGHRAALNSASETTGMWLYCIAWYTCLYTPQLSVMLT